LKLFHGVHVI